MRLQVKQARVMQPRMPTPREKQLWEKQPPVRMPSMKLWAVLQRMLTPWRRQLWEKQTRARVMQPSARLLRPLKLLEPKPIEPLLALAVALAV